MHEEALCSNHSLGNNYESCNLPGGIFVQVATKCPSITVCVSFQLHVHGSVFKNTNDSQLLPVRACMCSECVVVSVCVVLCVLSHQWHKMSKLCVCECLYVSGVFVQFCVLSIAISTNLLKLHWKHSFSLLCVKLEPKV